MSLTPKIPPPTRKRDAAPVDISEYADPGYLPDGKKRYPINTANDVIAAWKDFVQDIGNVGGKKKYTDDQIAAVKQKILAAAVKFDVKAAGHTNSRLPKENLYRAQAGGYSFRAANGKPAVLSGHFNKFDRWTEIDSVYEGRFMERFAPGAFKRTINNNRDSMRVLFNHGRDPQLGDKILGPIVDLREDDEGAYYEVELFDGVPDLLVDGLRAGSYGASFRFRVIREDFNKNPDESDYNPEGIPERVVTEAEVSEFGPVTFPAYADATAGVRSLTDEFRWLAWENEPARADEVAEFAAEVRGLPPLDLEKIRLAVSRQTEPEGADLDEDPAALAQAVDAVLDEIQEALAGGDTASALDLLVSAETTVDELIELLGGIDADDNDESDGPRSAPVADPPSVIGLAPPHPEKPGRPSITHFLARQKKRAS